MARKRSVPITQRDTPTANSLAGRKKLGKSHKSTQSTISLFHTLLKRKAQAQKALSNACSSSQASALQAQLGAVETEIEEQGGLDTYQRASTLGQSSERGGDSSVVLIEWLKEMNEAMTREDGAGSRSIRMLEIGALSPNNLAAKQPYITNTPIDLNSQHPDILAQDFLQRPLPKDDSERFDIVSCSLVLNFVPEPRDRGQMLKLIHQQLHHSERSFLFLVLPTACTENSRYMTSEHLETILGVVGFAQVRRRARPGGKVIYTLWKWQKPNANPQAVQSSSRRAELRSGTKRNNFVVLLK
ncbi:hypothetical protein QFC21_004254 [Naganishia friedmannii]|uniref:Uncharacterized protein n=1 Tax=Naganishia friedmannii TaxID=89922 RepID=A0ACC2VI44_9TREE|nr:hypothetical protein QFC21_004254 [Naganishia friedmannii]